MSAYPLPAVRPETPGATFDKNAKSTLVSRNITVSGRRTSVRLEPQMWQGLNDICRRERASIHEVCTHISLRKDKATSLTAAIRVYIMEYFRAATTEEGHMRARHGQGVLLDTSATREAMNSLAIVSGTAQALGKIETNTYAVGAARPPSVATR